jgi:type II secretory ATPase GspE/PulE/Tfp pilus assembly ATPase PilB-like protein
VNLSLNYSIIVYKTKDLIENIKDLSKSSNIKIDNNEKYIDILSKYDYICIHSEPYYLHIKDIIQFFLQDKKYLICIAPQIFIDQEISKIKTSYVNFSAIIDDADQFVLNLLRDAIYKYNSSDIHFETKNDSTDIRLRIDGTLRLYKTINIETYERVRRVIYINANLNDDQSIYIRNAKVRVDVDGKLYEFRLSSLPTSFGANIVLRQYSGISTKNTLDTLGFKGERMKLIQSLMYSPYGIFLISGPTGSGKTSTLYSVILELGKNMQNKIITIEDPIELNIPFATQVQTKEFSDNKENITFATAMRSFLRHDPDVILVGEIRDYETANEAINAANTGHLVLSTIHTNSSIEIITRLMSLQLERWKIASALLGGMSQRLYRKLCYTCKKSITREEYKKFLEEKHNIYLDEIKIYKDIEVFYTSDGIIHNTLCKNCNGIGYKGRTVLYEVFRLDDIARDLIETGESYIKIKNQIIANNNFITMIDDSYEHVKNGELSIEESFRLFGSKLYDTNT